MLKQFQGVPWVLTQSPLHVRPLRMTFVMGGNSHAGSRQITLPASWKTCMQVKMQLNWTWKMDWFQIGKEICQGCILSPGLLNLYSEYIMWNARLDEVQARIKIARRNINNLRYAVEKAMAPHSSTLAWKIPWTEEPGRLQSVGSRRVWHNWAISFSLFTFMHWRRKRQPTPVFLPGESQGWGSLVGCCLWGHTESDTTEVT